VIAYHQRRYGKSYKPEKISLEDYLEDLRNILEVCKIRHKEVFLIGHSFGGMVAQEFASRTKPKGLVLVGSIAIFKPDIMDRIIWKLPPSLWRRLLFTENILTRKMYRKIFFSDKTPIEIYKEFLKDNKEYIEELPPHVFRYSRYHKDYDASKSVSKIESPTLIIVGRMIG